MPGDLVYFVVPSSDAQRSQALYSSLFGWRFSPGSVPDGFNIDGATPPGGLFAGNEGGSSPAVYFDVEDIEAAGAKVRSLGGQAEDAQEIESGFISACRDDQGIEFNLWAPKRG